MTDLVILAPRPAAYTSARPLPPIDAAWTVVADDRRHGQDQTSIERAPAGVSPRLLTPPHDQVTPPNADWPPLWESSRFAAQCLAQGFAAETGSSVTRMQDAIAAYLRTRDAHIKFLGAREGLDLRV